MKIIVTGAAGFIGMQSCLKLLKLNYSVFGIDNLNEYYDRNLKLKRLELLKKIRNSNLKKLTFRTLKNYLKPLKNLNQILFFI